jgi:hypothetical protein
MLEKLGFQQLIEETLTIKRRTRSMAVFRFIRGDDSGLLRGHFAPESVSLSQTRSDAYRHP